MSRKKRKKSIIDELLEGSLFGDADKIFERFEKEDMGSGYSISVTQTPEGTKVYAKVGEGTDVNDVRRKLQQQYPNAQIEIEGGRPLIREISARSTEEEKDKRDKKGNQP